jgi:single-strand DNA-binding protein
VSGSLNRVYASGNLCRDPEYRQLPSGVPLCGLTLAISESYENKDGQRTERTVFLELTVWDKQAEWCSQNLRKGDRVAVEGSLQQDNWTDDQGNKRSKIKVRADRVHFLNRSSRREESGPASEAAPAPAARAAPPGSPAPHGPAPRRGHPAPAEA